MGEPIRLLRYLNILTGAGLMIGSFIVTTTSAAMVNNLVCGLMVPVLSLPRGTIRQSFGSWDRFVR
jgi:hypothetical protein